MTLRIAASRSPRRAGARVTAYEPHPESTRFLRRTGLGLTAPMWVAAGLAFTGLAIHLTAVALERRAA